MREYLKRHEHAVFAGIIGFALGFASSFLLIQLYTNRDIVGHFCSRTAKQAQEYLKNL